MGKRFGLGLAVVVTVASAPGTELAAQGVTNLAARQNGGEIVFFSSQFNDSSWNVENLIDGSADEGWAGQSGGPQAVVLGFGGDLVEIHDVLVNPYTREDPSNWVRQVEIEASTEYPFRGFRSLGTLELTAEGRNQLFSPPQPVPARYLRLTFLSNGGGGYMEAGEVQVMGRRLPDAPPAPSYRDLAAAAEGGRIESYTSQFNDSSWAAANLIAADGADQWAGTSGAAQEVVIALATALPVTDVAIDNYAREAVDNWAQEVTIEVSDSPYKGFRPVGRMTLPPVGGLHTLTLEQPVTAGYVKVLFRGNRGGGYMEAARVKVFTTEPPRAGIAEQIEESGRAVARDIHFATDSAEILPASEPVLREIAALLAAQPALELIIEGHTDDVGSAEHNLDLSRRRAEAVKRWLVDRGGVAEVRLVTVGYGASRPVAGNDSEEGRAANRRVELARK